ncbi:heparan N-sulfatase [Puteibacter caeruleilacunae]|nr:heparan N-sulfatase [Puteibacter caeruleilacunae]
MRKKTNLCYCIFIAMLFLTASCSQEQKKQPTRPNILFCIADDVTFQHMGAYGCTWVETPAFDRIANEGLLFTNAYTPNAKCAPSRSCIVTGRNSWQLEEAGNHWSYFPAKFKTYAETLIGNGYHVGYTAKGVAPVVALTKDGKQRAMLGKNYSKKRTSPPTKAISNIDYAANFIDFLEDKNENEPFCFWYGGFEPHRGYEYGSGIKVGNKKVDDVDKVFSFWPDKETTRTDMLDYALEIEYFDSHLQKMLDVLESKGMLENTLIVVTADNGMPFPRVKGQAYEYSNHLPLAIMWKNGIKNPGRKINEFVSFIDFAPTFLEVAQVDQNSTNMHPIQGRSLTDIFNQESQYERDHVLIGKERHDVGRPHDQGYPIRGIRKGDYLFILNFETDRWPSGNPETGYLNCDGGATKTQILSDRREEGQTEFWNQCFGKRPSRELYNVKLDPDCVNNLINQDDLKELANDLEKQMINELQQQRDPRMFGHGNLFDKYKYSNKSDRDFHTRFINGENPKAGWVNKSDFEPLEEVKKLNN